MNYLPSESDSESDDGNVKSTSTLPTISVAQLENQDVNLKKKRRRHRRHRSKKKKSRRKHRHRSSSPSSSSYSSSSYSSSSSEDKRIHSEDCRSSNRISKQTFVDMSAISSSIATPARPTPHSTQPRLFMGIPTAVGFQLFPTNVKMPAYAFPTGPSIGHINTYPTFQGVNQPSSIPFQKDPSSQLPNPPMNPTSQRYQYSSQ